MNIQRKSTVFVIALALILSILGLAEAQDQTQIEKLTYEDIVTLENVLGAMDATVASLDLVTQTIQEQKVAVLEARTLLRVRADRIGKKLLKGELAGAQLLPLADTGPNKTGRTVGDEIHELHERVEDAINEGFRELGDRVDRWAEERNSGCNNQNLGSRTREALGC